MSSAGSSVVRKMLGLSGSDTFVQNIMGGTAEISVGHY